MLERERPLDRRARRARPAARASSDSQYDATKPRIRSSSSSVTVGIPLAHLLDVGRARVAQVDRLQQPVRGVADLGREQAALAHPALRPLLAHPRDAQREVLVRAAPELGERREREPARAVQRRRRQRLERGQHRRRRARARGLLERLEQRELRPARRPAPRPRPAPPRGSGRRAAAPARRRARARPAPRPPTAARGSSSSRPSTQPIGVDASAALSGSMRAGDDQPVDRAGHRDVVEAQLLGLLLGLPRLADVLVVEGAVPLRASAGARPGSRSARRRARGSRPRTAAAGRGPRRRRSRP